MIYCEYKYNYYDNDFRNYMFIEFEDYSEIGIEVMGILENRTQIIISLFDKMIKVNYKKIAIDKFNYLYLIDDKYVVYAGMMCRQYAYLDKTMYTSESDDYCLNRRFPFVFSELVYGDSPIVDYEKLAHIVNYEFPAQVIAVFDVNQYYIRKLNDRSLLNDNDDKLHTFAKRFTSHLNLYELLQNNQDRQIITDNYDYNHVVNYLNMVIEKLQEYLSQFNCKVFCITEHEKVLLLEKTLVIYVGVKGSRSSFRDKTHKNGNVIDRYSIIIQELTYNELYNQPKFSKFVKSIHLMDGIGYNSQNHNNLHYRPFKTGDLNEIIIKGEHPQFWQTSNFEYVNKRLPDLRLRERYDTWEGFLYNFIVYELTVNGKTVINIAHTTNSKAVLEGYKILKSIDKYSCLYYGPLGEISEWGDAIRYLVNEAKMTKWKNVKKKGSVQSLLAEKVSFYIIEKYIKNKDDVDEVYTEVMKEANNNIGLPFERYTYDISEYKWKSEELMLECVEKVFKKNTVIHQYRPYFLRSKKGQMSYDVFVCGKNIAFEYQGKQHFEPVDYFGGEKHYEEQTERDTLKKKLSEENGITLIYVNYDEDVSVELIKEKVNQAIGNPDINN